MKNTDDKCFMWAVTRAAYPTENNADRISKKLREDATKLNWEGIEFPTPFLSKVYEQFESNNDMGVSIYGHRGENEVYVMRNPGKIFGKIITLFLANNGDGKYHYCVVRDKSKLMSSQRQNSKLRATFCPYCNKSFTALKKRVVENGKWSTEVIATADQRLTEHVCQGVGHNTYAPEEELPGEGKNLLRYNSYHLDFRVPLRVYFDFECALVKKNDDSSGKMVRFHKHVPVAFCIRFVSEVKELRFKPIYYPGPDAEKKFVWHMRQAAAKIDRAFPRPVPFDGCWEDLERHRKETSCHACGEPFVPGDKNYKKVLDHDHYTGKYRSSMYSICNLWARDDKTFPVFAHNGGNYDFHLLLRVLNEYDDGEVKCVMQSGEKVLYFSKFFLTRTYEDRFTGKQVKKGVKFVFKDSFKFLDRSIEYLAGTLEEKDFKHFKELHGDYWQLLTRKQVFPYHFLDGLDSLKHVGLPPMEEFSSYLGEGVLFGEDDVTTIEKSTIMPEDYEHAKTVFDMFGCRTFGDYVELYCRSDVDLLATIFERFIDTSMREYKVDPSQCPTAPAFFWQAALKESKVTIELLTCPQMYEFFEESIRGGVSVICNRLADASNPHMKSYDPGKPTSYIEDLDANGLYSTPMLEPLPVGGFRYLDAEEIKQLCYKLGRREKLGENRGVHLCVDLAYPKELHPTHSDFPLLPEKVRVNGVDKLVPNLYDKFDYKLTYDALLYAMEKGIVLKRVKSAIEYRQEPFLREFVLKCAKKRALVKNDF